MIRRHLSEAELDEIVSLIAWNEFESSASQWRARCGNPTQNQKLVECVYCECLCICSRDSGIKKGNYHASFYLCARRGDIASSLNWTDLSKNGVGKKCEKSRIARASAYKMCVIDDANACLWFPMISKFNQ